MKIFFAVIRHLITLPSDLGGWLLVLLIHAMWGRRLFWHKGVLVTVLKDDSWPRNSKKRWGGWYEKWAGTTFTASSIMLSESGMELKIFEHELQHSRQYVQSSFAFLIPALLVMIFWSWWFGLLLWLFGGLLMTIASFFESWSNGGAAYHDNIHEQHARAMVKDIPYQKLENVLDGKEEIKEWSVDF
jgi:hypothetical protein